MSVASAAPMSADHPAWEHAPEMIVVGAGFVAFMAYLAQEHRNERRRANGLPQSRVDRRQWLTVTLLVIAGLGHIPVIPQHLREAPYMGVLFIGFTLAAFAMAVALARNASLAHYTLAGGLCAAGVAAYVATRLIAFPQLADDVGAWREPLGLLSVAVEAAVAVIAVFEVRRLSGSRHRSAEVAAY